MWPSKISSAKGYFYPRPPRGERPLFLLCPVSGVIFLSTPSARRATCCSDCLCPVVLQISIHALREESDDGLGAADRSRPLFLSTPSARRATVWPSKISSAKGYFYPRPPRGERPLFLLCPVSGVIFLSTPSARRATFKYVAPVAGALFLSTPSARRATAAASMTTKPSSYFYPRPPRGERLLAYSTKYGAELISIHALREESDRTARLTLLLQQSFLSTPSARRATASSSRDGDFSQISIHALREESDLLYFTDTYYLKYISIHALREESDGEDGGQEQGRRDFYPRPPRGERQQKQRENTLLLSHYTPLCTNCKEMSVNQTAKSHRYLRKRLVFRCEASRETMCAAGSHWPDIKRSARCLGQILGAVQCARPWSGSCCPAGRTADCPRQGRSGRSALL